jgi:hypothetical protein
MLQGLLTAPESCFSLCLLECKEKKGLSYSSRIHKRVSSLPSLFHAPKNTITPGIELALHCM